MPVFVGPRRALLGQSLTPYLLYDAFNDTRAAGAVNGTPSTPPPDVEIIGAAPLRTVIDTNSKLSITGVLASYATGGVGGGDPGLWYPSQARMLGKTIIGIVTPITAGAARFRFGWASAQSGDLAGNGFDFSSVNGLKAIDTATTGALFTYVDATTYQCAVVLRASGAYFFVKGGTLTNWTLLWVSSGVNTSTLYPASLVGANSSIATADNIRVPVSLYIPTPLAYDTFTRADAALGNSETVGPDAQTTPAKAWTGATYTISTNKAINTPSLGADVIVNGGFGTDTDWNKGTGWSIAAGVAAAVTATSDLTAAVAPLTVGTWYSVTYTLSGFGAGTVNAKLGSTAFPTHAANATYTETGLALTTAFAFTGVGFTGSIDDVSCKPLTLSELFATMSLSTPDVMLDINCTMVGALTGKQVGIVSNLNSAASPTDFRLTILDGRSNVVVYDCIAGAYTVKATTAITYSAAAPLRTIVLGTALSRFYNNVLVGTTQTMAANASALAGIFSTSPLSSQDVWQAFAIGTLDSSYSGLNTL